MQKEDTSTSLRNASPSVLRRLVLKSALAGTAAFTMHLPAANAAPAMPDELAQLLAEYEAVRKRRNYLNSELERLESDPGCRLRSFVALRDVASRENDYPPELRDEIFVSEGHVERFFTSHESLFSIALFEEVRARRRADCDRAKILARAITMAQTEWERRSGYDVLDKEYEALVLREMDIENEICERPCESVNDALRKALFAASWLDGRELDTTIVWTLVGTIADFAREWCGNHGQSREAGPTDPVLLARIEDYRLAQAAFSLSVTRNTTIEALPETSPIVLDYMRTHDFLDERMVAAGRALLSHPCHTLHDIRIKTRQIAGNEDLSWIARENFPLLLEALSHA